MLLSCLLSIAPLLSDPAVQDPPAPRRVAIVVYQGVELLDFAGPGEVFAATHVDGRPAFEVFTVADREKPILSQGFVRVTPEYTYETCPKPDIVVVPGGGVPLRSPSLREWLVSCSQEGELVMSVCNGALALAVAGLLDELEVTTHRSSLQSLQLMAPSATVLSNRRFVDHGRVLTCAGVSAGIDGALQVVSRLHGEETARRTAHYMEYEWRPEEIRELHESPGERVGESAEIELLRLVEESGVEAAAARQRALPEGQRASRARVLRLGYTLLGVDRAEQATRVFELSVALAPDSAASCDALAEALELAGRPDAALAWSERALDLLPEDERLSERGATHVREASTGRVARLRDGIGTGAFACPPCGLPCDSRRFAEAGHCPLEACGMELVRVAPPAESPVPSRGEE